MFGYCASRCAGKTHGFAPPVEKNVSKNGEYGLRHVQNDRVLVRFVDLGDPIEARAAGHVVRGIEHGFETEHDVVRVKRRAVRPLHAFTQMIGNRQAVFADAAVLLRRDLREQFRDRIRFLSQRMR